MIQYFPTSTMTVYAVQTTKQLSAETLSKLHWLFATKQPDSTLPKDSLTGTFIGPRAAMVTPWSTNAVEITQNSIWSLPDGPSRSQTVRKWLQIIFLGFSCCGGSHNSKNSWS